MIRCEARTHYLTAYETIASSLSDPRSTGAFLALMQTRSSGHAPGAFSSESDKCADEFMARYKSFDELKIDTMLKYGAEPVDKAYDEAMKKSKKDNELLASLGTSPAAGLAQRDFIFSDRPWSDLPIIVAQFFRDHPEEQKSSQMEVKTPVNPFDDRSFLSESKTTRELKARTEPIGPARRSAPASSPEVYLFLFSYKNPREYDPVTVPYRESMTVAELKSHIRPAPKVTANEVFALCMKSRPVREESQTLKKLGIFPGHELRFWYVDSKPGTSWSTDYIQRATGKSTKTTAKRGRSGKSGYSRNSN